MASLAKQTLRWSRTAVTASPNRTDPLQRQHEGGNGGADAEAHEDWDDTTVAQTKQAACGDVALRWRSGLAIDAAVAMLHALATDKEASCV